MRVVTPRIKSKMKILVRTIWGNRYILLSEFKIETWNGKIYAICYAISMEKVSLQKRSKSYRKVWLVYSKDLPRNNFVILLIYWHFEKEPEANLVKSKGSNFQLQPGCEDVRLVFSKRFSRHLFTITYWFNRIQLRKKENSSTYTLCDLRDWGSHWKNTSAYVCTYPIVIFQTKKWRKILK